MKNRFLPVLGLLALLSSCEIPFDLKEGVEPRIYLQCVAYPDIVSVRPQVAQPVNGQPLDLSSLEVEVWLNDELLSRNEKDVSFDSAREGDRISVKVSGQGVQTVYGETRIVSSPNIVDYSWKRVQVDTIDAIQVSLVLDHAPGEEEHYGIRIGRYDEIVYMDGSEMSFVSPLTPGYILTAAESVGFDLADFVQVNFNGYYLGCQEYIPLTLIDRKQFDGPTYRFYLNSFDASILAGIRENLPDGDTGLAGGGIVSGQVGGEGGGGEVDPSQIPVQCTTSYYFVLFRLSPEFYYYARALYQSNFDFLANMGLVPANFTWSNVEGGLGFVGAVSYTSVGPLIPEEEL